MPGAISGLCLICSLKDAIYRCPSCSFTYCSLNCYKEHKGSSNCVAPKVETKDEGKRTEITVNPPPLRFTEEEEEKDRVKRSVLKKLGSSDSLKDMLQNRHLRAMLDEIDNAQDPGKHLISAMQIPIFTEFADECLKIVEPDSDRPTNYLKIS